MRAFLGQEQRKAKRTICWIKTHKVKAISKRRPGTFCLQGRKPVGPSKVKRSLLR